MSEVFNALAKVQASIGALKKSATNPHFRSKYIPLEEIVAASDPLFEEHGLLFYTYPTYLNDRDTVTPALGYTLRHLESGDVTGDIMPLVLDKQNSQGVGSAITYARRYILTSLLNIIADVDDDGNAASAPPKAAAKPAPPASFADEVKATGKKAAEIREWASNNGATLDDVGTDAAGLRNYLNGLDELKAKDLLEWANGN